MTQCRLRADGCVDLVICGVSEWFRKGKVDEMRSGGNVVADEKEAIQDVLGKDWSWDVDGVWVDRGSTFGLRGG